MACRACQAAGGLQTCLFCGDAFCALHRADVDGATACTACREAEVARRRRAAEAAKAAAAAGASDRQGRLSDRAPERASERQGAIGSPVAEGGAAPLPPLPEPGGGGLVAFVAAGAAAAVAALYLRWLSDRVVADAAKDATSTLDPAAAGQWMWAATSGGTLFVFVAVWLMVKSKKTR